MTVQPIVMADNPATSMRRHPRPFGHTVRALLASDQRGEGSRVWRLVSGWPPVSSAIKVVLSTIAVVDCRKTM
jgi:hypothetical protein